MNAITSETRGGPSKAVRGFVALLMVGIWIPILCTAPQLLGGYLWRTHGFSTDLPLAHLVRVSLNTVFVLAFLVLTKRTKMLAPERPKRPSVFFLFVPLMVVNVAQGPFTDAGVAIVLVSLAGTTLTGFWEEFLFRGLVQERLRVLGPRLSLLLTALMFALIHINKGPWPVLIAFGIGLAFCVARDRIGIWPLVFIHATIDFTSDVFVRRWEGFGLFGAAVVGAYGLVALFVLSRRSQKTE
ncbi:MAG: CPBP family intramembrane glutamic endopeptidase [Planctomycetota bacterium]